jgi:small-conductance mechanosensitive channel
MAQPHWILRLLPHAWWRHPAEVLVLGTAAWILHHFLIGWLRRLAARTPGRLDDALVEVLDRALRPLLVVAVAAGALNLLPLARSTRILVNRSFGLAAVLIGLYFLLRLLQVAVVAWAERRQADPSVGQLARTLTRVVFAIIALALVLDNLGISLTAVWTTLGVGSLAVALGLQDTLANFFAGFYLQLDRPIRPGDYIQIQNGPEGFVERIGWRSTRLRTLPNNTVVVPNTKLAQAILTNYSLPEPQLSLNIPISVSYDADPDQIERILVEEATAAASQVPGLLAEPEPFVRFIPGFGDSALQFTLICRVASFTDQYLAQHVLRKRILARFRREGITIPFPQRDVHLDWPQGGVTPK